MVQYLTASRSPATGQYTANCQLKKGFPYREDPIITVIYKTERTMAFTITLGDLRDCTCAIDCIQQADVEVTPPTPAASDPSHSNYVKVPVSVVCPAVEELTFVARVNSASQTSPTDFLLTFTDIFGNIKEITVSVLRWVVPKVPTVSLSTYTDPPTQFGAPIKGPYYSVDVTVPFQSTDSTNIKSSVKAYQVQRYTGHENNLYLVRGWAKPDLGTNPNNKAWDYLLLPGREYGYRVRYRGNDGDVTAWSAWETIQT